MFLGSILMWRSVSIISAFSSLMLFPAVAGNINDAQYHFTASAKFGLARDGGSVWNDTGNWGCVGCVGDVNYAGELSSDELLKNAGLYLGVETHSSWLYYGLQFGGTYLNAKQSDFVDTALRDHPHIGLEKSYSRGQDGYFTARILVGLHSGGWTPYLIAAPLIGKTSYAINIDQNSGEVIWSKNSSGWYPGYEIGGGLAFDLNQNYSFAFEYSEIGYFTKSSGLMDTNLPQYEMGFSNEDKLRQLSLFVTRKF